MSVYRFHIERRMATWVLIGHRVVVIAKDDVEAMAKVRALAAPGADYLYKIQRVEEVEGA